MRCPAGSSYIRFSLIAIGFNEGLFLCARRIPRAELLCVSNIAGNPVTRVLRLREAEIENRFLALPRQRTHGGTDFPLWPCGF